MSRIVVITGASAGVGRATALAFAALGDEVALLARGADGLAATKNEIERAGGRARVWPVDVSDAAAVDAAAEEIETAFGPIDVWVNNAMTAVLAPVSETSAAEFRRVTEVAYLGYVHGTLAALRHMRPRDHGVIIQVGSGLAYRAIPLQATYCGAKHAIRGFTDSLRCELIHDKSNVRVTMVLLPGLNTPQFGWVKTTLRHHPRPVAPVYQPEVAARAVLWAADHRRREVMVGAITPGMIWANKFVPGLLDRYLGRTNVQAQQMHKTIDPARPSYLWEPLPGDRGSHGIFDDGAHSRSAQFWLTTHRRATIAVAVGALAMRSLRRR